MMHKFMGWILFLLILPVTPHAGEEPAQETGILAKVHGKDMTHEDLNPPLEIIQEWKNSLKPEAFTNQVNRYRVQLIASKIWKPLIADTLTQNELNPTEEEIQNFLNNTHSLLSGSRQERDIERRALMAELLSPEITIARKNKIAERIDILNTLQAYDRRQEVAPENSVQREYQKKAEREGSQWMIKRWKFNKLLFDQYGGHVLFQEMGWEPVSAYKQFLEEHETKGTFSFTDEALRKAFFAYYKMNHRTVSKENADFYFQKPFWHRTREELVDHGLLKKKSTS